MTKIENQEGLNALVEMWAKNPNPSNTLEHYLNQITFGLILAIDNQLACRRDDPVQRVNPLYDLLK